MAWVQDAAINSLWHNNASGNDPTEDTPPANVTTGAVAVNTADGKMWVRVTNGGLSGWEELGTGGGTINASVDRYFAMYAGVDISTNTTTLESGPGILRGESNQSNTHANWVELWPSDSSGQTSGTNSVGLYANGVSGHDTVLGGTGSYGFTKVGTKSLWALCATTTYQKWVTVHSNDNASTNIFWPQGQPFASADIRLTSGSGTGNAIWEYFNLSSSQIYKKDIVNMTVDSSKVFDLVPRNFTWKDISTVHLANKNQPDFGLISEEVNLVLPELIEYQDLSRTVPLKVRYDKLSVLLLAEVKKLKARIEVLEAG